MKAQIKSIDELKAELAENRKKQSELEAQAKAEADAKLKAEAEVAATNVTKNEFVQNALRFAIMRGKQNKLIEQ